MLLFFRSNAYVMLIYLFIHSFFIVCKTLYRWDWLDVYDGDSMSAPSIGGGPFCGPTLPDVIESTGHSLLVRFVSDHHLTMTGFQIQVDAGMYSKCMVLHINDLKRLIETKYTNMSNTVIYFYSSRPGTILLRLVSNVLQSCCCLK